MSDSKVSAAQARATAKWEAANYDKSLIRFPKGTQARIKATGETVNGMVNRLVKAELDGLQPVTCPVDGINVAMNDTIVHSVDQAVKAGYGTSRDQYIIHATIEQLKRDRDSEIAKRRAAVAADLPPDE